MSALVVMLLLGFLLVIAASLTIWAALTLGDRTAPSALAVVPEVPAPEPPAAERPTNDDVRGARARVTQRRETADDAFERFLRSDSKRDESQF